MNIELLRDSVSYAPKIALIDTGLDDRHKFYKEKLKMFCEISQSGIHHNAAVSDENGHGTACAYIIDKYLPDYEIFAFKIYGKNLQTKSRYLVDALEICMEMNVDIINISMGMVSRKNYDRLEEVCKKLSDSGVIIMAASNETGTSCWPADFPFVIKVEGYDKKGKYDYCFYEGSPSIMKVYNGPQRAAWKDGQYTIVSGTSFACAKATGILSVIRAQDKEMSPQAIRTLLMQFSQNETHVREQHKESLRYPYHDIRKAILFPFNKEMHGLVRFEDDLEFTISRVVDLPFKGDVGKCARECIGLESGGISIESNFQKALDDAADTVILSDLSELSRIYRKDLVVKYAGMSFSKGKNVVSIEVLNPKTYETVLQLSKEYGCSFFALNSLFADCKLDMVPNIDFATPVLGVFGTGPKVGKFTVQVTLKKYLTTIGYNVANICTEPQGFLLGFETFPIGNYNLLNYISLDKQINYIKKKIIDLNHNNSPELIIIGGQSGVVPFSRDIQTDYNSLSSLIVLLASRPDGVILCVNPDDDTGYIKRTIQAIESTGYGKVFIVVMSNLSKEIVKSKMLTYEKKRHLNFEELEERCASLERELEIPVTNMLEAEGIKRSLIEIQNYFSRG